jgi:UDP-glucose 4-epimerase
MDRRRGQLPFGALRRMCPSDVELIVGDMRDERLQQRLWDAPPYDAVFHLAAYAAEGLPHHIRCFNYDMNLVVTARVVNGCLTSGAARLALPPRRPCTCSAVNRRPKPRYLRLAIPTGSPSWRLSSTSAPWVSVDGLPYSIFRPHNIDGEKQRLRDPFRNVVGIFLGAALRVSRCQSSATGPRREPFVPRGRDADHRPSARGRSRSEREVQHRG